MGSPAGLRTNTLSLEHDAQPTGFQDEQGRCRARESRRRRRLREDIDVIMENRILSIKGEREFEDDVKENGFRRVERMYGTFYRRFSLPDYATA